MTHSVTPAAEPDRYSTGFHGVRVVFPDHTTRTFVNADAAVRALLPLLTTAQLEVLKLDGLPHAQHEAARRRPAG